MEREFVILRSIGERETALGLHPSSDQSSANTASCRTLSLGSTVE